MRIVHLLEHTTGWDDIHLPECAHNDPTPLTLQQGLEYHPHSRVSRWKPGSRFAYCNSGPAVAARVIEIVTGQEFEAYITENFFLSMGMNTASYRMTENVDNHGATLMASSILFFPVWGIRKLRGKIPSGATIGARIWA